MGGKERSRARRASQGQEGIDLLRKAVADKATAASPASSGDTVNLTSSAKLLERLDKTLASLPAVDSERVAEIKAAIENGDYQIDADAIADAMIRLDRSLGE